MIISNTKRKKPINIDNIQRIIDGGEKQFKSIYNNLKNNFKEELMSKLISRLFNTLEKQKMEIEQYKQEIKALKNNLVYLLKRILLSKNKEIPIVSNFNKMQDYSKNLKTYSSTTNYSTFTSFSPKNQSSSSLKLFTSFNNKTEISKDNNLTSKPTIPFPFNRPQSEIDIKVNNYIDSLYRKNFCTNETNINDYYSLNKTQNIYEEVSQKMRKSSYNKSFTSLNSNINSISNRNISSSKHDSHYDRQSKNKTKRKNLNYHVAHTTRYSLNNEDISSLNYNVDNTLDNFLKVKKKNSERKTNNKTELKYCRSYKSLSHISKGQIHNKKNNMCFKKKINNKTNHYIPKSRSPFLINKI